MSVEKSIARLRKQGYKITPTRKSVLEALEKASRPLSPYDIQKLTGKNGKRLSPVTIYRILYLFCSLNLAHRVPSLVGFIKCSNNDDDNCHRFLICRNCRNLQEFADSTLCEAENKLARERGFQTEQHVAESLGLCINCQSKQ